MGFPASLLREVRERIRPGTSALFVLSTDETTGWLRDVVPDGELVVHRLTTEQKAALDRAFGTRVAP